jgi:MFS family permease
MTMQKSNAAQRWTSLSAAGIRRALFPFGWGNVTKLALAYFFSTLYFYIPVGTLYLQGKGLDYVQINSIWGIIVATMFLTEVPTGVIADRIGRKRAVNLALGLQVLGEVIFIFARGYGLFVVSAVVGGLGFAFGSGCVEALVYESLSERGRKDEMTKAMGYIEAAQRLANLIAFSLGGVLIANLTQERFVAAIVITACAVAVGFLVSLTVSESGVHLDGEDERTQAPSSLQLVRDGLALIRGNRLFARLVLLALFSIPFVDYLGSLYQPHFVEAGVQPFWFGLARALAAGLCILGARYAYWLEEHLGPRWALLIVTGMPGLLYLIMAQVSHPVYSVLAFLALFGSTSLRGPILSGQMNAVIQSENRATVLSLISALSGLYVAGIGLLFGWIAERAVSYALMAMGLVVLMGSLVFRVRRGIVTEGG